MPGVNMKPDLIPSSVDAKCPTRRFAKKRICTLQGWRGYSPLCNIPSLTLIVHSILRPWNGTVTRQSMSRLLMLIVLMLSASSAWAEWTWVGEDPDTGLTAYIDYETMRR